MPCPLTFGVELEFALATVTDRFEIHLELEGSKRHYWFQPTPEDIAQKNSSFSISPQTIHHHIAQTLKDNGFAANPEDPDPGKYNNFNMWSVKEDASIEPPEDNPFMYTWIPIEVTSPKFTYSKNAINEVMAICKLIVGTYIVDCNKTTGLHVHVGYGSGEGKFPFYDIQRLFAFLFAFEPQLNSLHPPYRQNDVFFLPIRASPELIEKNGRMMNPLEGLQEIFARKNFRSLEGLTKNQLLAVNFRRVFREASGYVTPDGKMSRIDPDGIREYVDIAERKPTVEFRQHEGTLDPERVQHWIATVMGIMKFVIGICEYRQPKYVDLMRKCTSETLECLNDVNIPTFAESEFTVFDLLREIGVPKQADYYQERGMFVHRPHYYYQSSLRRAPRRLPPVNTRT